MVRASSAAQCHQVVKRHGPSPEMLAGQIQANASICSLAYLYYPIVGPGEQDWKGGVIPGPGECNDGTLADEAIAGTRIRDKVLPRSDRWLVAHPFQKPR